MPDDQMMLLEDGSLVHLVHFTYQDGGVWKVACAPNLPCLSSVRGRAMPWRRSDDPRAVNCPLCQATGPYGAAAARNPPSPRRPS